MNTAVRHIRQGFHPRAKNPAHFNLKQYFSVGVLLITLLLSALAVIYIKDLNRRLFSDVQLLEKKYDELNIEWGQLLLEQSAWSTQSRVQMIAQSDLGMFVPSAKDIVLIGR